MSPQTGNDPMVHVVDHPLVQHKLTLMRKKRCKHQQLSHAAQ